MKKSLLAFILSGVLLMSGCIGTGAPILIENPGDAGANYPTNLLDPGFVMPERGETGTIEISEENLESLMKSVKRPDQYELSFWVTYHSGGLYQRTSGKQYRDGETTLIFRYENSEELYRVFSNGESIKIKIPGGVQAVEKRSGGLFDAEEFANMPTTKGLTENTDEITLRRTVYDAAADDEVVEIEISYNDTDIQERLVISLSSGLILRQESYAGGEETPFYAYGVAGFTSGLSLLDLAAEF